MTFERINPPPLAAPRGFNHAVVTDRRRTVYLAGQTALDRSGTIVGDDIATQFEQALLNLLQALTAAGGSGDDLASVTIYIVDMDAYQARSREIGTIWRRLVGTEYPAVAGIGVARLWDADALIEIQGIAVLD
ncbi:enamine deaminase RidA (YjgF/YER057c/UK114 family) [Pseudonocardia hierapolitana]|uniref:Enamine deaminase RidA (YjgF/YER057c/UK114 family) n=1 Tax=Pseudonocardia hierapolitana TaxID=1128676 RepID=A0A561T0J0_9PSEU|nr:RidA family protein [Pseudonocardia hierapolitana]TWF80629.1 enamine deaminase RidA (YjgF/YER057c/UK114 family) [Pseudonocardia hierapolitana]